MSGNDYLKKVILTYSVETGSTSPAYKAAQQIAPLIRKWAGEDLVDIYLSGSYAKGTAIRGSTDIDLFISLSPNTPHALRGIYEGLDSYFFRNGFHPRKQDVSIGIEHSSIHIDLIPAKKHPGNTNDHSLFRNKANTWTQTNVQQHIDLIKESDRLDEIKAIKIWRNLHNLDFPSFYLELTVLDALYGKSKNQLETNILEVLRYLRDKFKDAKVVDPANSNNIISDDLTTLGKLLISLQASSSCLQSNWNKIIW